MRAEIHVVIKCSSGDDASIITPNDFEFINMSGKNASVLLCKEGFEWNGQAVKELAGSGSIYVRLKKSLSIEILSDSDKEIKSEAGSSPETSGLSHQSTYGVGTMSTQPSLTNQLSPTPFDRTSRSLSRTPSPQHTPPPTPPPDSGNVCDPQALKQWESN